MKRIETYKRSIMTISLIGLCILLLTKCISKEDAGIAVIKNNKGEEFAGSASCATCHKNIYDDHLTTAHYLTSQPALEKNIKGSFEPGTNKFIFPNNVELAMERRNDGLFQVAYVRGEEKKSERFDIVIGSGTKGQSYLSWRDNRLSQLPITYFTAEHQWSNSPGYPGKPAFNRVITSRCLECHSTYIKTISQPGVEPEEYDHQQVIYGVDCEKCHGPGAKHVEYQQQNPKDTIGKYLINPAVLSRQQNLDLCALCHGGRLSKTQPSFGFEPGDKLTDYFKIDTVGRDVTSIDVHGNQFGLLATSKCFVRSEMTCSSCHNVHVNEKAKIDVLSQRCMNCHGKEHVNPCKMTAKIGASIVGNCIDCHMPKQPSQSIAVLLQGAALPTAALMRTHLIKVYPEETKKVLTSISQLPKTN